ncbi:MAG: trypsin-like peptidase domain-containing protein [Planctomycetes bacterium]|nr:trypsin-like peptidase domain-containing protein [Planctomycetota bacterium]
MSSIPNRVPRALAWLVALSFFVDANHAQVATIGERHEHVVASPSPYARSHPFGKAVWTHRIVHPGASYLRVELDLDLAMGDVLEVLDAHGDVCWRYGGDGPLDGETFLTDTVFSDVVTMRLIAPVGGGAGVRVHAYEAGHPWLVISQGIETACHGGSPFEDLTCSVDPMERRVGEAMCALLLPGGVLCTASFVGPAGHVLTANHCVATRRDARRANLWLRHQERCGTNVLDPVRATVIPAPLELLVDDRANDISLVLPPVNGASIVGHLALEERDPTPGEPLVTVSHAGGRPKEITRGVMPNEPFVDGCIGTQRGTHFAHRLDTQSGSSGAPIVRAASGCIVGVHTCGGCQLLDPASYNTAARTTAFVPNLRARVPSVATCATPGAFGDLRRGGRLRIDAGGAFDRAALPVLPGGDVVITLDANAPAVLVLLLDALHGAPRFVNPGQTITLAVPWNAAPGAAPLELVDAQGSHRSTLQLDVGVESTAGQPSFTTFTRHVPLAHEAPPVLSMTRAVAGNVASLDRHEEGSYRASALVLEPGPVGMTRTSCADVFRFDLTGTGVRSGNDLAVLRLSASFFARALRDGAPLEPFPSAPRRSSDAVAVHAWRFEVLDALTGSWLPLADFVDPAAYGFGAPWRGSTYAEAWSAPGAAWPGVVDQVLAAPPMGVVDPSSRNVVVRLVTDVTLERTAERASVVHVFDEVLLDLQPRGVAILGPSCRGNAGILPRVRFRGAMTPGASFTCDLERARPAGPALLWHGDAGTPTNLGAFGLPDCVWHLDPRADIIAMSTDGGGHARVTFHLPAEVSFVGTMRTWQWMVFDGTSIDERAVTAALSLRIVP